MLKRAYIFAGLAIIGAGLAGTAWASAGTRAGSTSRAARPAVGVATRPATVPSGDATLPATLPAGGATLPETIPANGAGRDGARSGTGGVVAPTVKGNVNIQMPIGWVSAGDLGGQAVIAAQAPSVDEDATGRGRAMLAIAASPGNAFDGATVQATQARTLQDYQKIEPPTPVVIGGLKGVMFGGSFKSGNAEAWCRQYLFTANNQLYTITFTCLKSKWATYQGAVEASVATFTVKK